MCYIDCMTKVLMLILTVIASQLYADTGYPAFADYADVRKEYARLFSDPVDSLDSFDSRTRRVSETGTEIEISVESGKNTIAVFEPVYPQGHTSAMYVGYSIVRNSYTGKVERLEVFFDRDKVLRLTLTPQHERSMMNLYVHNQLVTGTISVPFSVRQLFRLEVVEMLSLTERWISWKNVLSPYDDRHSAVRAAAELFIEHVGKIPDADDGARDKNGRYVYIDDGSPQKGKGGLNCSGFAKWIVDSMYYHVTGTYVTIAELKKRHTSIRGTKWSKVHETSRDPYFGLDWTRNLAMVYNAAVLDEFSQGADHDVTDVPYFSYTPDAGYPVEDIAAILYILAVRRPGMFYAASINTAYGSAPVLRQHVHVAVFFPYFTRDGSYKLVQLERGYRSTPESLRERYPGSMVHFTQLPAIKGFEVQLP